MKLFDTNSAASLVMNVCTRGVCISRIPAYISTAIASAVNQNILSIFFTKTFYPANDKNQTDSKPTRKNNKNIR